MAGLALNILGVRSGIKLLAMDNKSVKWAVPDIKSNLAIAFYILNGTKTAPPERHPQDQCQLSQDPRLFEALDPAHHH
jgi:hypothetical protein